MSSSTAEDLSEVTDIDVSEELSTSFMAYSMSVIVSRALPDVRDGLKPVHRRILWSMHEQGMRPDKGYSKCARAVGDVMGKYHPHGDMAIYDALVRLAQPWSMRLPLIDGHGNFGSLDDGPAASRYTEARLAPAAMSMVEELSEDTVDFRPNYDGREREPVVLPSALPNLLVNGSTGIAVGMATNMPPHNLVEVVAGLTAMLENPEITVDELMAHIPGPDFPTGGVIYGLEGLRDAYSGGRGTFRVRATASIEDVTPRRKGIVVTALPFNVGPERVIARIRDLVQAKKLPGVSDVKDYSDRKTGLRLVIEVKTGFNPAAVLEELYRTTPLDEGFSMNNVALVQSRPQTLGLVDLCRYYLDHRLEVVRRRSEFRLRKAQERAHILEGLLVALGAIDEVIAIVRGSKDSATARAKLCKRFKLSERQAEAILEMTIRRLTGLEVGKIKSELSDLKRIISDLTSLLASPVRMRDTVAAELTQVAQDYGTPRRTRLISGDLTAAAVPLEVPDDPCVVSLSAAGALSRSPQVPTSTKNAWRGHAATTALGQVLLVSAQGVAARVPVHDIPEASTGSKSTRHGIPSKELAGFDALAVVALEPDSVLTLVTRGGMVKRLLLSSLTGKAEQRIISLKDGDVLVGVSVSPSLADSDASSIVVVTSLAQLLRFPATTVRPQGASSAGMTGIKLGAEAYVLCSASVPDARAEEFLVSTLSDTGSGKSTPVADYPVKGRGGSGVRCQSLRKAESALTLAAVGEGLPLGVSPTGTAVALTLPRARRDASGSGSLDGLAHLLHA